MEQMRLIECIEKRETERALELIASEPDSARSRNSQGVSALMLARYFNLREVGDALLATHPALDVFEAASYGRLTELGRLLDEDPARVNSRSPDGGTALHFASFFAQANCARELIARGADIHSVSATFGNVQPLHSAAAGRSAEIVRCLLEAGADPNAQQGQGWTALHSAAQNGDLESVKALLKHGADADSRAESGKTALDLARSAGHVEVAALLMK